MSTDELAKERAVFEERIGEWRQSHLGRFVLIHGPDVIGFFDSLDAAFDEGTRRFGLKPFFVQLIVPSDGVNVSFFGQRILAS